MPVQRFDLATGIWYDISKKRMAKTSPIQLPGVMVATPVTTPPTVRPTGPDYVRWEDLYVAVNDLRTDGTVDVSTVLQRCPTGGKIVTFPEGVISCSDFVSNAYSYQAGISIPKHVKGLIGSGQGVLGRTDIGTVFTMKPMSSGAVGRGWVPGANSGTPIQTNVMKHGNPQYPPVYRNFQVVGSAQGHVFSLFQVTGSPGAAEGTDLLLAGWDGNDGKPPGETSALAISGVGAHQFTRMEIDGRRAIGGEVFGAMGATFQNSVGATFTDCNSHHCRAANFVFYASFNSVLKNCIIDATVPTDKALGNGCMNLERTSGSKLIGCTIIGRPGKVHITHSNDYLSLGRDGQTYSAAGGSLEIVDPTWNGLWSDGLLYVQTWTPYRVGRYTVGPTGSAPTYATAVSNGYTGTQLAWEQSPSANSMRFPGATGIDYGSGPNDGPDTSPRVYKSNGTPVAYKWVFEKHRVLSHGPTGASTVIR